MKTGSEEMTAARVMKEGSVNPKTEQQSYFEVKREENGAAAVIAHTGRHSSYRWEGVQVGEAAGREKSPLFDCG